MYTILSRSFTLMTAVLYEIRLEELSSDIYGGRAFSSLSSSELASLCSSLYLYDPKIFFKRFQRKVNVYPLSIHFFKFPLHIIRI